MTRLSRSCPIGFSFTVEGDFPGIASERFMLVGWMNATPLFDSEAASCVWSARLEECAQAAYMNSLDRIRGRASEVKASS